MTKKIGRLVLTLVGMALAIALVEAFNELIVGMGYQRINDLLQLWALVLIYVAVGILSGIISYIFSPKLINSFIRLIRAIEERLSDMALSDIVFAVAGLIVGLVIAFLLTAITRTIEFAPLKLVIDITLYIGLGCLGWSLVVKRRSEINVPDLFKRSAKNVKASPAARPKILDTSAIIDGRIADVCATGIIEGILVVPSFVLDELRHIADHADSLKRNRGRRGLDILTRMQTEQGLNVKVVDMVYEDIEEVDVKLIKLASDMGGVIVTNDYNLNKVAGVQRVPVLNINDLSNAVKPVMLVGEEFNVEVVKEGKESNQGVAYLDDGTMIVVENGRNVIGQTVSVVVTSVLQTSAGRMIFAKLK